MTADSLREKFLKFFESKSHRIVASDSLAPKDDPTVLFTPAGMNQFKKEFMGYDSGFKRATTSQRCLRTDDLDKVGKTDCHHTLFEMLGNFSFGDYFKKEAIAWAWEFLTVELKISPEKLWVSVYKDDDEAYTIWQNDIGFPTGKIVRLGDKANFWPSEAKEKGPNGPCGPCSEIFFDLGSSVGCGNPGCDPGCSCGRFIEIWNLVFTQFNRKEGGVLESLPQKNIDTGMGLERITAVMQGKRNNFETDLFQPIIKEIEREIADPEKTKEREPVYAIADHLRAVSFSIYDGILPSNEKQGYVVRKLIRKSVLHLRGLGVQKPFLFKLVSVLADVMRNPYPDLKIRRENIADIVLSEEKNFIDILSSSPKVLEENFKEFTGVFEADGMCISRIAAVAFKLYDTHGIPLEVTKQWLQQNVPVFKRINQDEFNNFFERELNQQKSRSKAQSQMQGDVFDIKDPELSIKQTDFCGYNLLCTNAEILKILRDTLSLEKVTSGDEVTIILDRTGFYAESGGQAGDTGLLLSGENIFEVIDTRKIGKVITHHGIMKSGSLKVGDTVQAAVNEERRLSIARNHTATHLLQAALRKVLGPHVQQQGSLVAEDRFRFDFTHFKELQEEERARVEELVNGYIVSNYPVSKEEMSLEEAKNRGALAFFGEKYEQTVRVISVAGVSQELCGGTHVDATGQIGILKIIQEGSVASGVRRIEAVTGKFAYKKINEEERILSEVTVLLNVPLEKINQELLKRLQQIRDLGKEVKQLNYSIIQNQTDELIMSADVVNGIKVIASVNNNLDMELLRKALDLVRAKVHNSGAVIVFCSRNDDKVFLVVGVTQDLVQKGVDASKLIQEPACIIGGKGGGRKDFAQAGGTQADAFPQAFENIKQSVKTFTL